jgi:hypothetical protein
MAIKMKLITKKFQSQFHLSSPTFSSNDIARRGCWVRIDIAIKDKRIKLRNFSNSSTIFTPQVRTKCELINFNVSCL